MVRTALLCLALVALAGPASAVPVDLYWHVSPNGGGEATDGMNTELPPADVAIVASQGPTQCSPDGIRRDIALIPRSVRYEDGEAAADTMGGLWETLRLVPGSTPALHVFLTTEQAGLPIQPPAFLQNVIVEAKIIDGPKDFMDSPTKNHVRASARSDAVTLAGPVTQGVAHETVGEHEVYAFDIPIPLDNHTFGLGWGNGYSNGGGFWLSILAQSSTSCIGGLNDGLAFFSDAQHRPRLSLDVIDPTFVHLREFQTENNTVVVIESGSVFGRYDSDITQRHIVIEGVPADRVEQADLVPDFHCHCVDDPHAGAGPHRGYVVVKDTAKKPIANWSVKVDGVQNLQHTATASGAYAVTQEVKEQPPAQLALVLLGVLVLAVLRKRAA